MEKNNVQDGIIKHDKGSFNVNGRQLEAESILNVQALHSVKSRVIGGFLLAKDVILRNVQRSVNYKPQKTGFKIDAIAGTIEVGHLIVGEGGITGPGSPATLTSKARAYQAGDDAHSGTGPSKALFDTKTYDVDSEFDVSTNHRFTATAAGYYAVNVQIRFTPNGDQQTYVCAIRVNNVERARNNLVSSGSIIQAVNLSDIVSLSAGDYIEAWVDSSAGSNWTIRGGANYTFMSIHRLS